MKRVTPEQTRERVRRWKREHPERVREMNRRYDERRRAQAKAELRARKQEMDRRCAKCGEPISVEKFITAKYCSRRCKHAAVSARWWKQNLAEFKAQQAAWRERNRHKLREKKHRRRALELAAYVEPVGAVVVYERDRGLCGLCEKPVELADVSIDHVIPLARGGTHEYANVQLAHLSCNASKRHRMPSDDELQAFRARIAA